jgi:hypothetical protein
MNSTEQETYNSIRVLNDFQKIDLSKSEGSRKYPSEIQESSTYSHESPPNSPDLGDNSEDDEIIPPSGFPVDNQVDLNYEENFNSSSDSIISKIFNEKEVCLIPNFVFDASNEMETVDDAKESIKRSQEILCNNIIQKLYKESKNVRKILKEKMNNPKKNRSQRTRIAFDRKYKKSLERLTKIKETLQKF